MLNSIEDTNPEFHQRKTEVFSALDSLEIAHLEVNKATKKERKIIQKTTWRHAETAPENLAEQKKSREKLQKSEGGFRKPFPFKQQQHQIRRDPRKWTHYSLENIDEDASLPRNSEFSSDPNASIASAFINELRQRKSDTSVTDESPNKETQKQHRILFRSSRGMKRRRIANEDSSDPSTSSFNLQPNKNILHLSEYDDDNEERKSCGKLSPNDFSMSKSYAASGETIFTVRRHKGRIRNRCTDIDEIDHKSNLDNEIIIPEKEQTSDSETDLINDDDMEQDPEQDKTNDFLA